MVKIWLSKAEFMVKYAPSDSTYRRRVKELKSIPQFSEGYISPTGNEVWIDEEIYQNFLIWKSRNRGKVRKS